MKNKFLLLLMCALFSSALFAQNVYYVAEKYGTTSALDKAYIQTLWDAGYTVDTTAVDSANFSPVLAEAADLMIIGRSISSGDYGSTGKAKASMFDTVTTPIIIIAPHVLRTSRWKITNENDQGDWNFTDTTVGYFAMNDNADPMFNNVVATNDTFAYGAAQISASKTVTAAQFMEENNGKLLGFLADTNIGADSIFCAARWTPGIKTYSAGVTPSSYWTFLAGSSGDAYKAQRDTVFLNEVAYLIGGPVPPAVTSIEVSAAGETDIRAFATVQLNAQVYPKYAADQSFEWSSDDEAVATVDANGLVTGIGAGTATITATTNDGSYTDTQDITVTAPKVILISKGNDSSYVGPLVAENLSVTRAYVTDAGFSLSMLDTFDVVLLGRDISSSDFTNSIGWSNVTTPVVSLAAPAMRNSKLKFIDGNHADFTLDTNDVGEYDTLWIAVSDDSDAMFDGITFATADTLDFAIGKTSLVVYQADSLEKYHSATLLATALGSTALGEDTLGGGLVLACRFPAGEETYAGSGVIPLNTWSYLGSSADSTHTANGMKMIINEINAVAGSTPLVGADSIILAAAGNATSVDSASTLQISASIYPANATFTDLTWSASDTNIATVDASGLLTTKTTGTVVVTATNFRGVKGMISIEVTKIPSAIENVELANTNLYYNAVNDVLVILNSNEVENVQIYNLSGQQIINVDTYNTNPAEINTAELQKGLYIVRMKMTSGQIQGAKFVKQ